MMSALADERRELPRPRRRLKHPAHSQRQVLRAEMIEAHGAVLESRDRIDQVTALAAAKIKVAVGEFQGQARRDLIGEARIERPGEVPGTDAAGKGARGRRGS